MLAQENTTGKPLVIDGNAGQGTLEMLQKARLFTQTGDGAEAAFAELKKSHIDDEKRIPLIRGAMKKLLTLHMDEFTDAEAQTLEFAINLSFETKYVAMVALRSFLHNDPDGKKFLQQNPEFWENIEQSWAQYVEKREKAKWQEISNMLVHFGKQEKAKEGLQQNLHCRYLIPAIMESMLITHVSETIVPEIQKQ